MEKAAAEKLAGVRRSGEKLTRVMDELLGVVKVGMTLKEIDERADELIAAVGGRPAFKAVPGYKYATCINVNAGVVHGIPTEYRVKEKDVVSVDVGLEFGGWVSDTAWTMVMGESEGELVGFLEAGKRALLAGVEEVKDGGRVGDVTAAIDMTLKRAGWVAFSALTGHGVGRKLHEEPYVPNVLRGARERTAGIREGMTLALEVIYTMGRDELVRLPDGWTLVAGDGKITASFEVTCAAGKKAGEVLTPIKPWREFVS